MMLHYSNACGLALVLLLGSQGAQEPMFVLEAGEHTVESLIEKSGEFLERTYVLDSRQSPQPGKIDIPRRVTLNKTGCEEFVGQLLYSSGWVAVPLDVDRGLYDWVWLQGPKAMQIKQNARRLTANEIIARPKVVDYVTTVFQGKQLSAVYASASLRQFFNDPRGQTQVIAVGGQATGAMMLTGFRPQVARMLEMLKELDAGAKVPAPLDQRVAALEKAVARLKARLTAR